MKYLIQAEAIVLFIFSVFLINTLPMSFSWWVWMLLFLAPDISMIGYAVNNRVGAVVYNVFHYQLVAVAVWAAGLMSGLVYLQLAGLVLLGHSSLDRVMGYGLKRAEGFKFTHLGDLGK